MNGIPSTDDCLTLEQLAQFLESDTNVSSETQVHLESCNACQRRLESMIDSELHREIGSRYRENEQPELAAKMFREGAACAQRAANNPYRMDRDPTFYNELAQQLLQLAADAEKDILL